MTKTEAITRRSVISGAAAVASTGAIAATPANSANPDQVLIDLGAQLRAAWEHERAAQYTEDRVFEAAYKASHDIVAQIEKHRAFSIEGLRTKALAISWCQGDDGAIDLRGIEDKPTTDRRLAMSIINDLLTAKP